MQPKLGKICFLVMVSLKYIIVPNKFGRKYALITLSFSIIILHHFVFLLYSFTPQCTIKLGCRKILVSKKFQYWSRKIWSQQSLGIIANLWRAFSRIRIIRGCALLRLITFRGLTNRCRVSLKKQFPTENANP